MQTDYIIELLRELTNRIVILTRKVEELGALYVSGGGSGDG